MPLYEYQCQECHRRMEKIQNFSAPPEKICPSCGGELKRLISAPALQFKGAGWYVNDYAKSGGKTKPSESSDGKPENKSGGKAETVTAGASESSADTSSKGSSTTSDSSSSGTMSVAPAPSSGGNSSSATKSE